MQEFTKVLDAISFAARYHKGQTRADDETPYISHPFRVMTILTCLFGITDPNILCAAILHDVIEDTEASYDKIDKAFGKEVAQYVASLTKDMRLPKKERELEFLEEIEAANPAVKLCKLADMYDNLMDTENIDGGKLASIVQKAKAVIASINSDPNRDPKILDDAVSQVQSILPKES